MKKYNEGGQEFVTFSGEYQKDLTNHVNNYVVFYPQENKFYKIACVDYRNFRYELWGERMTRWIIFEKAIFLNYHDDELFDKYFKLYQEANKGKRDFKKTKEEMIAWFEHSESRISFLPDYLRVLQEREKLEEKEGKAENNHKKKINIEKNSWE